MKEGVEAIRQRMRNGQPDEGDLAWCKQRLRALREWPEPLNYIEHEEVIQIQTWLQDYA